MVGERARRQYCRGMDGRAVDRAVREIVRPSLKDAGFTEFTGRKSWRFQPATIELVTFRSFTSYIAAGVGCTTFSFALTAGVWYRCLDVDLVKPEDYHLTFSFELGKTLRQPWFTHEGAANRWDRPDVWYVLPDGSNLDESVRDAAAVLVASGLPLLDRFAVPELAYRALLTEASHNSDFGVPGIAMPGRPGSPRWRETGLAIGHLVVDDPRADLETAPVLAG
jgi:hypothetical protein